MLAACSLLILLAGATGCSSNGENLGQIIGMRSSISDTAPLVANRAQFTAYDPHHHAAEPTTSPRLLQASMPRH